jgi:hypothetical protein
VVGGYRAAGWCGLVGSLLETLPHCTASKPLLLFAGSQPPATMSLNQVVLMHSKKRGKRSFGLQYR